MYLLLALYYNDGTLQKCWFVCPEHQRRVGNRWRQRRWSKYRRIIVGQVCLHTEPQRHCQSQRRWRLRKLVPQFKCRLPCALGKQSPVLHHTEVWVVRLVDWNVITLFLLIMSYNVVAHGSAQHSAQQTHLHKRRIRNTQSGKEINFSRWVPVCLSFFSSSPCRLSWVQCTSNPLFGLFAVILMIT